MGNKKDYEINVTIEIAKEDEYALEENYRNGIKYAISLLKNINIKKDNKLPV